MSTHGVIDRALGKLAECELAIKANDSPRALRELGDAILAIKGIVSDVKRLERSGK